MGKHKVSKRYLIFIVIIISWAALYMAGHSSYVSNYLKKIILERSAKYTEQKISIDEVFINPVPIFFELRGISIEDQKEGQWLKAGRIKIYIDVIDLFREKISIRRVLLHDADLRLKKDNIAVMGAVGRGASGQSNIVIRNIEVRKSRFLYKDSDVEIKGSSVNLSAYLKTVPEVNFDISGIDVKSKTLSVSDISAKGRVYIKRDVLDIDSLSLVSVASSLDVKGKYYPKIGDFALETRMKLSVMELSKILDMGVKKEGRINTFGSIRYFQGELSANTRVSGRFFLESLMSLLELKEPLRGLTKFDGTISIEAGEIAADGTAEMINGHIYGVDIDKVSCEVSYAENRLSFKNGSAKLYDGTAEADVYITLPRVDRFMVNVKANKVNATDVLKLINFDIDVSDGKATGELRSEGERFEPEGWFVAGFDIEKGNVLKRISRAEGKFNKKGSSLLLRDLLIRTDESNMDINGKVDLKNSELTLYGNLNTGELADVINPYYEGLSGSGSAVFSVTGSLKSPVIKGGIRASDISYRSFYYEELETAFNYKKELLEISNLMLKSGKELHRLNGNIGFSDAEHLFDLNDPEFDITAEIMNLKLQQIAKEYGYYSLPVEGLVTSTIAVNGPLSDLRVKAQIIATQVSVYNILLDSVKADAEFINNTFNFSNLIINRGDSIISGALNIDLDGNYKFSTDLVIIQLGQIPFDLNIEKGIVDVELSGKGSIKHPYVKSKLKISDVVAEGVPVGYGEIEIILRDNEVTASGKLFDGKAELRAGLNLGADLKWELDIGLNRGAYNFIPAYLLKDVPEDLMMSMEGDLRIYGDKESYNGYLRLSKFNLSMYGLHFANSSDMKIGFFQREILFEQVNLKSGNSSFSVEGSLIPFKQFDLSIYGGSSLAVLKNMFNSINDVKGYGSFVFSVQGGWDDPVINGGISVKDTVVGITGFAYKVIDLSSYIYIDNNRVVIDSLTGYISGGKIDIKGFGQLESLKVKMFHLDAKLNDATFRIARGIVANFDGALILKGELGRSSIVGQVNIKKARYTQRVDWKTQLIRAKVTGKPRGTLSRFERTELNIKIEGDKDIVVNNNIAKTTLKVELLLRGTVAKPVLFGRIETDKGIVYFRNNEFEIIHASADFIDPDRINPYFDITANTSVKGYNIRVVIEGKMPQLDLSLTSDPPLDETDILGLLTVGEVGSKLGGLEAGIGTAEATSLLTGKYQDVIEERLTLLTGIDRFQVEPYVSKKTGEIGPRVTVSKRLIEDKLFVTYSSSVGYSEGDVIKLEYQLNKNVSLVGVEDELGSLGGDIIFRFEFK